MSEQVILPRYDGGSDWGSQRRVIARSATHLLFIWPGSFYSDNGGRHYTRASLRIATRDRHYPGSKWSIGSELAEGRISNATLRANAEKIDAAFGAGTTAKLDVRQTLEVG